MVYPDYTATHGQVNGYKGHTKYTQIEKLSEGGFAQVYKCSHNKKEYALKCMDLKHIQNFEYEVHILKYINHSFICKMVDSYQDSHLNIVLELIKGQGVISRIEDTTSTISMKKVYVSLVDASFAPYNICIESKYL